MSAEHPLARRALDLGLRESRARRVALVTNIPAPYRLPVYNAIDAESGIDLHVVFCSDREPNREWNLPTLIRPHYFLKDRFLHFRGHYIHFNLDVGRCLKTIAPEVVITTGFSPTFLFAVIYAMRNHCVHITMTDGTVASEKNFSWAHRRARRWVYRRSRAFVAAADAGLNLYRAYGCSERHLFRSVLCVNNHAFASIKGQTKRFDFLFCGRLVDIKNPLFALEVARTTARMLARRVSICFVGSGPLDADIWKRAAAMPDVDVSMPGFATQEELPSRYAAARIFLLPSLWDPWGVVANEACAAGLVVITSPHAGVAGELVREGQSGFVRSLDVISWAEAALRLLKDDRLYAVMSEHARRIVNQDYNFRAAADGLIAAVQHASDPAWKGQSSAFNSEHTDGSMARR